MEQNFLKKILSIFSRPKKPKFLVSERNFPAKNRYFYHILNILGRNFYVVIEFFFKSFNFLIELSPEKCLLSVFFGKNLYLKVEISAQRHFLKEKWRNIEEVEYFIVLRENSPEKKFLFLSKNVYSTKIFETKSYQRVKQFRKFSLNLKSHNFYY